MRFGIAGMTGRMGRLLIEECRAAGHEVVGGTVRNGPVPDGIPALSLPDLAADADVVIEFTHASVAALHAETMARAGTPWVLGTSGLSAADESALDQAAETIPVVYAANFGVGINLLLAFARQLGASLPASQYDAEILEMHHRQKVDAPSGTAIALGRAVAQGRGVRLESVMQSGRDGHTGPRPDGAIGFAALRGGQVVGEHAVLFAAAGEQIALSHRALDRRAFAAGAVRAAAWAADRQPGRYGMADVMGLPS